MLLSEPPKINLILGLHHHQPYGNWDWVIEEAYTAAYRPFLDAVERHAGVKVTLHYTGYLLEWLEERHPDFLDQLRRLVARGQVELMTGGFYAPVLAVIPAEDQQGQIRRLSTHLEERFTTQPEGMWLAERVWEPHLARALAEAGVQWTAVDDSVFKAAGLRGNQLFGYYQTEDQGRTLEVFPLHNELMRMLPYASPEKVIEHLRGLASTDGNRVVCCLDDGEKFGVWPNSFKAVYEAGWLDRLFHLIETQDWIVSTTVRDYRANRRPFGRIYLPSGSYDQLQEWALPPEEAVAFAEARSALAERHAVFVRGGMWRNFLVRYPESNNLHKKMLLVAEKVQAASRLGSLVGGPPVLGSWEAAREGVWKGQSADPYWHGVFGGLYLTHLRAASYKALLDAEVMSDRLTHGDRPFLVAEERDFDCDGKPEILVSSATQNLYFNLEGGALFELDFKPRRVNVLDTLARRHEAYHDKIARATTLEAFTREGGIRAIYDVVLTKEAGLERFLYHDWYRRLSFLDHFLHPDSHLESFYNVSYGEQGDFVNQPYRSALEADAHEVRLTLSRDGHVWVGPEFWPVTVIKRFVIPRDGSRVVAEYQVVNGSDRPVALWFGVEFNANFLAGNAPDRYYHTPGVVIPDPRLGSKGELSHLTSLSLRDAYQGLELRLGWSQPATVWRFPVETISMSEGGVERVYQSSVIMPHWRLELAPRAAHGLRFEQELLELPLPRPDSP